MRNDLGPGEWAALWIVAIMLIGGTGATYFLAGLAVTWRIIDGDALSALSELEPESIQTCVTSPPYWGLRDYGTAEWTGGDSACAHVHQQGGRNPETAGKQLTNRGTIETQYATVCAICGAERVDSQLGLEPTPELYVENLVSVFRAVRRVLRDDGTLWLNLGDSYATGAGRVGDHPGGGAQGAGWKGLTTPPNRMPIPGLKPKDLVGIPWMVAFALRADGWYLRSDVIWSKPNPMPESVTDRPTKAHEYLFLLTKSPRYFYDADAIRENFADERMGDPGQYDRTTLAAKGANNDRMDTGVLNDGAGWSRGPELGGRNKRDVWSVEPVPLFDAGEPELEPAPTRREPTRGEAYGAARGANGRAPDRDGGFQTGSANRRSVWSVTSQPFPGAHFATFPTKLIEPCVLAGSAPGATILDPFSGAGTTGIVATRLDRSYIGVELNPEYAEMSRNRIRDDAPLLNVDLELS